MTKKELKELKKMSTEEIFDFVFTEAELTPQIKISADSVYDTDLEDRADIFLIDEQLKLYIVLIESGDVLLHKFFNSLDQAIVFSKKTLIEFRVNPY